MYMKERSINSLQYFITMPNDRKFVTIPQPIRKKGKKECCCTELIAISQIFVHDLNKTLKHPGKFEVSSCDV